VLNVSAAIEPDAAGGLPKGEVAAYVFSAGGKLLETAPLNADGGAALKVPVTDEPTGARVMIGPRLEKPDLSELLRRGAVEAHVRLDPKELAPVEFTIGPDIWPCWFLGLCVAKGTVLKRTLHDGEPLDLPVCGAEVEVYEVDPIWIIIPRLPDIVLEDIRDVLLHKIPIPDPPPEQLRALELPALPQPLAIAAKAGSVAQLRRQLVLNADIAKLILCWIRPHFVTKTLIGTAVTDECGHFRLLFFRGCSNPDQPDLYFRVLQPLFYGLKLPIYEPAPVSCYTHWDYVCGTEVTIYTSSPFAQTCSPCPPLDPGGVDNYVAVMHVGNTLTSNIQGVRSGGPVTQRGLLTDGRPFGGTLNPHLEFDPQLRDSLGVRYYRVTVQRPGGGDPYPLEIECFRHYRHAVAGGEVVEPYRLGPSTINGTPHLFEIPPSVPPIGVWSTPNAYEDMASAKWNSTAQAPGVPDDEADRSGLFELKIELFDVNGAPVDTAALSIGWLVPQEPSVSGAAVLHLVAPDPSCIDGSAFLLPLHVDNNPTSAEVDPPLLDGVAAADSCGVMRYAPAGGTVKLPYRARHRNGFATYTFTVKRGAQELTPPSTSGTVAATTFEPTRSVDLLRGSCPMAAFLEDLWVYGTAFDGWTRVGYDAHDSRAFALAPQ
jgi:hypothetical protein